MIDIHSATWVAIEHSALSEIARGRDNLEQADDPVERGRIMAYREILKLAEPISEQTVIVKYDE